MLRSTAAVGVASGFTLSQLGFVLATIGGLTIPGGGAHRSGTHVVVAGVAAAVVGLVLMGLGDQHGHRCVPLTASRRSADG